MVDDLPPVSDLGPIDWPPAPIRTERLVLRASEARDRAGVIELFASRQVGTFIGGPQPREELERTVPAVPGSRAGFFVVELDGAMIGTVTLDRRDAERRGHVAPDSRAPWLGYLFLPGAWGRGYAAEACSGPRVVRQRASGRAGGAQHPGRQRALRPTRDEAGFHRGGAVRGVGRRPVVRRLVAYAAILLSSRWAACSWARGGSCAVRELHPTRSGRRRRRRRVADMALRPRAQGRDLLVVEGRQVGVAHSPRSAVARVAGDDAFAVGGRAVQDVVDVPVGVVVGEDRPPNPFKAGGNS